MNCELCGCDVHEAAGRGAFLKRVNEKGVPGVWQCRPSCDRVTGTPDDALVRAVTGDDAALAAKGEKNDV